MDIMSWFSASSIGTVLTFLLYGAIVLIPLVGVGIWIRNKYKYKYEGEVHKRRERDPVTGEPQSKKLEGPAGYFQDKQGATVFRIKYGWKPWDIIETRELPDPEHMSNDNRAIYLQYDKDNLVQAKKKIDWDVGDVKIKPISDNLKWSAQQDILAQERTLHSGSTLKRRMMELGALVLIILGGIIVFYFNTQACG